MVPEPLRGGVTGCLMALTAPARQGFPGSLSQESPRAGTALVCRPRRLGSRCGSPSAFPSGPWYPDSTLQPLPFFLFPATACVRPGEQRPSTRGASSPSQTLHVVPSLVVMARRLEVGSEPRRERGKANEAALGTDLPDIRIQTCNYEIISGFR